MVARPGGAPQRPEQAAEHRLAELHRLFQQPLHGYLIKAMLGDRAAAEDIVQETFMRAWRYLARNPDVDVTGMRPWLYTVARRLVIDLLRARRARPHEVGVDDLSGLAVADDAVTGLVRAETVRAALRTLSDEHRTILLELYFYDRTPSEVAERLGIPVGTVRSRSYYAKRALRASLED